jgi:hypothetical protein
VDFLSTSLSRFPGPLFKYLIQVKVKQLSLRLHITADEQISNFQSDPINWNEQIQLTNHSSERN